MREKIYPIVVLTALLATILIFINKFNRPFIWPSNGTIDFIEYWSAFKLFLSGENLYLPANQAAIQSQLGNSGDPIMMWNPPWLLVILSPIMQFSFLTSAKIWLGTSITIYALSLFFTYLSIPKRYRSVSPLILLILASYIPFVEVIAFGQIGTLFSLALSLFLLCNSKGWYLISGVALSLLSVKPHLFFLVFIALALWSIRTKIYTPWVGLAIGCLALVIPTLAISPSSIHYWIDSMTSDKQLSGATDVNFWVGTNLVGLLRTVSAPIIGDGMAYQFKWIIPGIAAISLYLYLIRQKAPTDLKEIFHWLLPYSLFMAPFGWSFDQVAASTALLLLLADQRIRPTRIAQLLVLTTSLITLTALGTVFKWQHQLFWYLPVIFMILIYKREQTIKNQ